MKLASIDIGTNSMRLLLAEYQQGFLNRQKTTTITRLGKGVDQHGKIDPKTMQQNIEVLASYVDLAHKEKAQQIYIMATSALRDSKNREEFVQKAWDLTGQRVHIISGQEEAKLGFLGVTAGLKDQLGNVLMIDIGGGSTEFTLGDSEGNIHFSKSEDIGAVRLTEKFCPDPVVSQTQVNKIRQYVQEVTFCTIETIKTYQFETVVGIGGTATTIAAVLQALEPYDTTKVHQYIIHHKQLTTLLRQLAQTPLEKRKLRKGLDPKRADVIVAGIAILMEIMQGLNIQEIMVSEYDNLEGLIFDRYR